MNETRFDISQFKVGAEVGNFRILRVLGEGGMGAVFEAQDLKLGRKVALKVMHAHIANIPGAKEKFLREARTAASVEHDRIVRIYSIHDEGDFPYITMELLQGESLHHYLTRQRIPSLGFTLQVGLHVAQGLQVAHAAGLIHRDIKPSNIWIEPYEGSGFRCKILDFGLARGGTDGAISHATNQGMGTPMYMSPEQWQGVGLDGRSDLFSLGVILYQMGSGQMPFEGDTLPSIMFAVMQNEPQLVGSLNPGLPKGLSAIIMRLLEKDKNDRPASGKEVAEIMSDLLRDNERLLRDDPTADPNERPLPSPEIETQAEASMPRGYIATQADPSSINYATPRSELSIDPPSILQPPRNFAMIGIILGAVLVALIVGIIAFWPKGDTNSTVVKKEPEQGQIGTDQEEKKENKQEPEKLPQKEKLPVNEGKIDPNPMPEKKAGTVPPPPPKKLLTLLDCSGDVGLTPGEVTRFQQEYAEQNGLRVNYSLDLGNGVSMAFVLIPPGKFWMGAVPGEQDTIDQFPGGKKRPPETLDVPRHLVIITKPFYLGKFEVKRGEFARFTSAFGYKTTAEEANGAEGWDEGQKKFSKGPDKRFSWKNPGWTITDEHPVVNVSWNDCDAFVEWAGHQPAAKFPEGFKRLRLVSEAEWEYACRAGSQTVFASGNDGKELPKFGNVADATLKEVLPSLTTIPLKDGFAFTAPVGKFPANAFGIHDLTGNVLEWCRDGYAKFPPAFQTTVEDPEGPNASDERVIRGGSFLGWAPQQRISRRDMDKPTVRLYHLGFRVVIEQ